MKDYKRMKTKQIRLTGGQSVVRSLDQGDRSLICSPKMRIEKRKSVAASVSSCLGWMEGESRRQFYGIVCLDVAFFHMY